MLPEGQFKKGLLRHLAEVERHTCQEVKRLSEALASLQSENLQLKRQLAKDALSIDSLEGPCFVAETTEGDIDAERNGLWTPPQAKLSVETPGALVRSRSSRSSGPQLRSPLPGNNETLATTSGRDWRQFAVRLKGRNDTISLEQYRNDGLAQVVVKNAWFQNGMLMVVILNALWLAIDLDFNGKPLLESPVGYQIVEHVFVAVFLAEVVLRFMALKQAHMVCQHRWCLFDAVIAAMMAVDTWGVTVIYLVTGSSKVQHLGIFSTLKTVRLVRLANVARIMRLTPEFGTMIQSTVAGVRTVLVAIMVLLGMTYCFAIVLRQLGGTTTWGEEYFSSIPSSIYTLSVESLLPDHAPLLNLILSESWYCGFLYGLFLILSVVFLMNMLIGVLCDVISNESQDAQQRRCIAKMSEQLQSLLRSIDQNYDGVVSKSEFESMIQNEEAIKVFSDAGIDVSALTDDCHCIFDRPGRSQLPFEDFKEEVLRFRRTSAATVGAITATRRLLFLSLEEIADRMAALEFYAQRKDLAAEVPQSESRGVCLKDERCQSVPSAGESTFLRFARPRCIGPFW